MTLKYLVAASAASIVVIALTADRAVSQQKAKSFRPALSAVSTLTLSGAAAAS